MKKTPLYIIDQHQELVLANRDLDAIGEEANQKMKEAREKATKVWDRVYDFLAEQGNPHDRKTHNLQFKNGVLYSSPESNFKEDLKEMIKAAAEAAEDND